MMRLDVRQALHSRLTDFAFAARALRREPSVAVLGVLSLAIAIAACVVVLGLWDATLGQALPYREPDRLFHARSGTQLEDESGWTSEPDFLDYQRLAGPEFRGFGAVATRDMTFRTGDGAYPIESAEASPEFLPLLGVEPLLGRLFDQSHDGEGAGGVVVLSHHFWTVHLGRDPGVIGTSLLLDDVPHTVLGILPERAALYIPDAAPSRVTPDVWRPLRARIGRNPRTGRYLFVVGRLSEGATWESARARAARLSTELQPAAGAERPDFLMRPVPLRNELVAASRGPLNALLLSVVVVLLVACLNVGGLLVEFQSRRRLEFATRLALGATRLRLASQLVAEAACIGAVATVTGAVIAALSFGTLQGLVPATVPRFGDALFSPRVALGTIALLLLVVMITSWRPIVRTERGPDELARSLTTRAVTAPVSRRSRLDGAIATYVAFSMTLLAGASFALRSALNVLDVDVGFEVRDAVTFEVSLPDSRYPTDEGVGAFLERLRGELAALPGVTSVGYANALPLSGGGMRTAHALPGATADDWRESDLGVVSEGFLDALGVRLLSGRMLTAADGRSGPQRVVVDETLARRLWPDGDAVGQSLAVRSIVSMAPFRVGDIDVEVVGVVRHMRSRTPVAQVRSQVYVPHGRVPFRRMRFVIRSSDPAGATASVHSVVRSLDPAVPVGALRPLADYRRDAMSQYAFLATLLLVFAGLGGSLAVVGVYSVTAFRVSARLREFGLRFALGASPRSVLWLVLRRSLVAAACGVALGAVGSVLLGRLLAPHLFDVSPTDPATIAAFATAAAGLSILGSIGPALRALAADPAATLTDPG